MSVIQKARGWLGLLRRPAKGRRVLEALSPGDETGVALPGPRSPWPLRFDPRPAASAPPWDGDEIALRALPAHAAGWSAMSASIFTEFKITTAQINLTGQVTNPVSNSLDVRKLQTVGTAAANNVTGGGDIGFCFQQTVGGGAVAVIDLTTMTDYLNRASQNIARVKAVQFRLLSAADDSIISPAPTATSACLITNNPPTGNSFDVPCALDFGNGGSGLTLTLTAPGNPGPLTAVTIGAAGSGYPKSSFFLVAPQQAGGNGACVGVITNASGVPTSVVFLSGAAGANYTAATVPSVVLGQHYILTGGAYCYFDPAANGLSLVSATNKKIAIVNLDAANAITVEVDILAGTS